MKKRKAVLIVGGSGFVGTHLALQLRKNYKVYATFHRKFFSIPDVSFFPMDTFEKDWVKRIVYIAEPDAVVFASGNSDPIWAEQNPREAERDHAGGAMTVLSAAEILQPKFIYLSNAYVFEGDKGNYHEDDTSLPSSQIGKVKSRCENFIRSRSLNYIIVRSSQLYGRGNGRHISFLDNIRLKLDRGDSVELSDHEYHSFGTIYGLVEMIERLIDSGVKNRTFHYGGLAKLTPYQFGKKFAERFGYDSKLIMPQKIVATGEYSFRRTTDYSLNFSESVKQLKINPLLVEQGFDLLEKNLIVPA